MRKIQAFGAVLGAAALALSLVACGGDKSTTSTTPADTPPAEETATAEDFAVGTWELKSAEIDGLAISEEDYEEAAAQGIFITIDLSEDGTVLFDLSGDQLDGTWEPKDDETITITIDGDVIDVPVSEDELVLEYDGDTITFGKVSDTPGAGSGFSADSGETPLDDEDDFDVDDGGGSATGDYEDRFTEESIEQQDAYVDVYVTQTSEIELVVADDETAGIAIMGLGEDYEDTGYVVLIENRTDEDLYIQNAYTDLDGEDVWDDATLARVVPAGETRYGFFWFDADAGLSVDENSTIEAAFGLYDINQNEVGVYWFEI